MVWVLFKERFEDHRLFAKGVNAIIEENIRSQGVFKMAKNEKKKKYTICPI